MDANDLTPDKARAIADHLAPTLDFLTRLAERMESRDWKPTDPAYLAATGARDALRELTAALLEPTPPPGGPRPWEPGGSGRN